MSVRCRKCDGEARLVDADSFELPQEKLGIKGIVIVGGVVKHHICDNCGDVGLTIPDLPGLIAAAAVARVRMPWKLNAKEVRFLRKALGLSAKELADKLEVTPETVSRWENGKAPIGPSNEKLLRMNVGLGLASRAPGVNFDQNQIAEMKIQAAYEPDSLPKLVFRRIPVLIKAKDDGAKEEEVWLKAA